LGWTITCSCSGQSGFEQSGSVGIEISGASIESFVAAGKDGEGAGIGGLRRFTSAKSFFDPKRLQGAIIRQVFALLLTNRAGERCSFAASCCPKSPCNPIRDF
jgi:hypothetical protein